MHGRWGAQRQRATDLKCGVEFLVLACLVFRQKNDFSDEISGRRFPRAPMVQSHNKRSRSIVRRIDRVSSNLRGLGQRRAGRVFHIRLADARIPGAQKSTLRFIMLWGCRVAGTPIIPFHTFF